MLELRNISKKYKNRRRNVNALKEVNLTFEEKGFVLICGESGGGKTTLLNIIAGIVKPTNGRVFYKNKPLRSNKEILKFRAENIGYIFQEYNLLEDLTIKENFMLIKSMKNMKKDESDIKSILKQVNLDNVENAYPSELSGGQRQRVAIARALFMESNIILADEPTGALDEKNALEVINILKEISKNRLVIVVSHNEHLVEPFADRTIRFHEGVVVEDKSYNQNLGVVNFKEEVPFKSKGLNLKYALKLGLKYFKLKSFKLYLSIIILMISFVILLTVVGIMFFNENDAYNMGVKNEKIGYVVIEKYEVEDKTTYRKKYFSDDEIDYIVENFDSSSLIIQGSHSGRLITNTLNDQTFMSYGIASLTKEKIKEYGFNLLGELPNDNEIIITREIANLIGLTDETYQSASIIMREVTFNISGILDTYINENGNGSGVGFGALNWVLYVNQTNYNYYKNKNNSVVYQILVESSTFSHISEVIDGLEVLDGLSESELSHVYSFENIVYNSIFRMRIFVDSIFTVGTIAGIIFIVFSILLLINFVYGSVLENKQDIQIIKMMGGKNYDIFKIFVVQPLLITFISLMLAIGAYLFVQSYLNDYVKYEFSIFIPLLNLNIFKTTFIILTILSVVLISTVIPVMHIKKSSK